MSRAMVMHHVLYVIIGGCAITKLLLMRFHKAPNQAIAPYILANSLKNNSFPKTITNWRTRRAQKIALHYNQASISTFTQAQAAPYPNIIIHGRHIRQEQGGGISSQM